MRAAHVDKLEMLVCKLGSVFEKLRPNHPRDFR